MAAHWHPWLLLPRGVGRVLPTSLEVSQAPRREEVQGLPTPGESRHYHCILHSSSPHKAPDGEQPPSSLHWLVPELPWEGGLTPSPGGLRSVTRDPPWPTCPQRDRPSSPGPIKSCGPCRRNTSAHRRGDRSGEDRDDMGHAVRVSPQPCCPGSSRPWKINQQSKTREV